MPERDAIPAYLPKLCALHAVGTITPGLHRAVIYHDDWCAIYAVSPSVCNCEPDIEICAVDAPRETA